MIKAVLLDLDNTLLNNPDHHFAIKFVEALNQHFYRETRIANIADHFRQSIHTVSTEHSSRQTNTQTMLKILSLNTELPIKVVVQYMDEFYATVYDSLEIYTSPVAKSSDLLQSLLAQNISIAIATNPIYPKTAILKRIKWAGLSDFLDNFVLITHGDNMYCAKPHLSYYKEILAHIDLQPHETIMVGDSVKNDMQPANQLGMHTVHITENYTLSHFYEHVIEHDWHYSYT